MSKKIVAMLMAVAMAFSLLPVTAFATDGTSDTTTPDVVSGYYENNAWTQGELIRTDSLTDTVTTVNKTATKVANQDNQYEVTLTVQMKHKTTEVPPGAAATVLVIDTSGSMNDDNRLSAAKTAAINFLKSYSGFSESAFHENGSLKNSVSDKNLKRYVSLVTFNDSASVQEWGNRKDKESWIDVSTNDGYKKLLDAINAIEADGGTNLDAALRLAKEQMQSSSITQIDQSKKNVIALTDGVPTYYVDKTWGDVSQHGSYGCPETNTATTRSADALKANVNAVYTVCFGAENDQCWTKGSVHVDHLILKDEKHTTDGPTVSDFLKDNIATTPTSEKKYAYNANDADGLYEAFAAITQTITDGLNEGVVTDGLPTGVTAVAGSGFTERWELNPNAAEKATDGDYTVYTYTKTYKVNVNPATVKTVEVSGVDYAPLNTPTTLTVQNGGEEVKIPFPIPAGKVTYSLTDFNKALVTEKDNFSNPPTDVTIPANENSTVTVGENGVTLLYKITVEGNAGAKFTVTDTGARLVSPKDNSITEDTANSTFSGTVGDGGTTVFYVSKHFAQENIVTSGDTKSVSNTATIAPGDNAKGPDNNTATATTPAKEPDPQTYMVTYQWADENRPSDATLPTGNPFILNVGQKHTVQPVPTSNVKENNGKAGTWICTWDATSNEIQRNAGEDITIKGTWTFTEDQPTTGNLIVKKVVSGENLTLNNLPDGFKITVTAGEGQEPIDLTLNGTNYTATRDNANTTATWTIPNLTPGEYTVSEENAGVNGYNYTATYSATDGATVIVNNANTAQNQPTTDQASQKVTVTAGSESTMTVTNAYTKNQGPVTPTDQGKISKSKTATKLDSNYESKVTLSIPSSEEQLVSDVVFVLDKSTSASLESQALAMLSNLKNQINQTGAKVNVGVVIFNKVANIANDGKFFDLATEYSDIEKAIKQEISSGTNTHAGLLAGKDMLDADKTVDSNRKYLVFVSDGITYIYNKEPTVTAWTFLGDAWNTWAGPDNWASKYGSTEAPSDWNAWIQNIALKVTEQGTNYEYPYGGTVSQATPQENWNTAYANSTDKALYLTYQVYQDIVEAGYHCYAMTAESDSAQVYPWGTSFMSYLSDGKEVTFDSIQNDILYTVSAGSRVEDYMGYVEGDYNFDFINDVSKLSITVGTEENQETLKAEKIAENHYGFGRIEKEKEPEAVQEMTTSEISYRYELEYVPGEKKGDEYFIWRINVPVSNFAPVALTYFVKLVNPKSASGTYGQYDEDGSKNYSGLYTNNSATLYPVDSKGQSGVPENFLKPTVSYTVKGSSGSHSGGSRPSLNTKDHYGYIIGYPVDYYTGQPTTDQTKKPVRPEGKITRAEVATIYFRMLTDESRTKFWSQSNSYSDVKAGDWFNNAVSTLSKAGIIAGYEDGSFKPNGYITRAEFATIAARFFDVTYNGKDLFPDISGHWAKDYINQAANKGFVNGYEDGTFKPDRNITRAEAVTLVNRTLDRHPDKNHFTKDMLVWPDNMDQTKWYYADMQEATNSHTYQMKENSDKTKYENWTKTLPIRNWEALEKAWSNANSSQGNGNVV